MRFIGDGSTLTRKQSGEQISYFVRHWQERGFGLWAVERLDTVIQAYAEVLRSDPGNADAAYNYEYAVRFRDSIARARPGARGRGPFPLTVVPVRTTGAGPSTCRRRSDRAAP